MTQQNKKFTLDITKVVTGLTMVGSFCYYAGKLDERTTKNTADIAEMKQDIKDIKAAVFQPVTQRTAKR